MESQPFGCVCQRLQWACTRFKLCKMADGTGRGETPMTKFLENEPPGGSLHRLWQWSQIWREMSFLKNFSLSHLQVSVYALQQTHWTKMSAKNCLLDLDMSGILWKKTTGKWEEKRSGSYVAVGAWNSLRKNAQRNQGEKGWTQQHALCG